MTFLRLWVQSQVQGICLGEQIEAVPFGTVRPCKDAERFWLFYLEFNSDHIGLAVA